MADNFLDFTIRVKDEASESIKSIGVSAEDLNKGIRAVKEETDRLNSKLVNLTQMGQAFDMIQQSVQQLEGVCRNLSDAYQVQLVAETQLETVMRQRMSATTEEIQSIKDLASAQQELGVIGDEVQLSGAQQIATFVSQKSSLESLIPAMNNLLAQQKGLNATNQDAVGIGNMMGKAMQGQVDVLQRVGITFTDAQKKVLQYGEESERAAMLAQVIRDNVGDMNAELAKTDVGKQKQLENTLGDLKEKLGSLVQGAMPFLTVTAAVTTTIAGVLRLIVSVKALTAGFSKNTVAAIANTMQTRLQSQARTLLTAATGAATASTRALTAATLALGAAYTAGLSLAIYAIYDALFGTAKAADSAAAKQDLLKESTEAFKNSASQLKGELDMEISSLATLIKSHGDETGKVTELNRKYGEALGYHKSAAEWYDVLIRKSGDYCKAIGYEAQAKVIASQKAEKEMQLEAINKQRNTLEGSGKATEKKKVWKSAGGGGSYSMVVDMPTAEYDKLTREAEILDKEIETLKSSFEECMKKASEGAAALDFGSKTTDVTAMSYEQLGKEIESTERKLKGLAPTETAEINRLSAYNKELKMRKEALGEMMELGDGGGKGSLKSDITGSSGSIAVLEKQLSELKEKQKKAPIEEQLTFTPDIVSLENMITGIKIRLEHAKFEVQYTLKPIQEGKPVASPIKDSMKSSLEKGAPLADFKIPKMDIEKPLSDMEAWNAALDKAREKNAATIESLGAVGGAMGALGNVVGGAAGQWLDWGANCMQAIATAIPQIAALTVAKKGEATANAESAVTGVASSVASIPWVGPILAVAAVASLLAAFAGIPKFANGAIAYGPTLGLFGEYAGASNNPEVVAPLNKLKQLIQPVDGTSGGRVEFVIDGRTLKGLLNKVDNFNSRTR